jgi:hypothetical protein
VKQERGCPVARTVTSRPAEPPIAVLVPVARSAGTGSASPRDARADVPSLVLLPLRRAPAPPGRPRARWPADGEWSRLGLLRDFLWPLARGGRQLARRPRPLVLVLVLAVQVALSLRLAWTNTASGEEGGCLSAGRLELAHWLHGMPLPPLAACPSGAPVIYPVLGALASGLGGLGAARILSLGFMLAATVLLRATAARLYGAAAGFWAGAGWALLAPTIRLGAFATADAMALFLLALAAWLAVGGRDRRDPARWMLAVAAVLLLANATEYATALFDPVVAAGAALVGSASPRGRTAWRRAAFLVSGLIIAIIAAPRIGGGRYLSGLRALASAGRLVDFGAWLAAIAVGYGTVRLVARVRRRRPRLAADLALGLIGALVPLAVVGARQAAAGYSWPGAGYLVPGLARAVGGQDRVLADNAPTLEYYLAATSWRQWSSMSGLTLPSGRQLATGGNRFGPYRAALAHHYFRFVVLDFTTDPRLDVQIAVYLHQGHGYRFAGAVPFSNPQGRGSFLVWELVPAARGIRPGRTDP